MSICACVSEGVLSFSHFAVDLSFNTNFTVYCRLLASVSFLLFAS